MANQERRAKHEGRLSKTKSLAPVPVARVAGQAAVTLRHPVRKASKVIRNAATADANDAPDVGDSDTRPICEATHTVSAVPKTQRSSENEIYNSIRSPSFARLTLVDVEEQVVLDELIELQRAREVSKNARERQSRRGSSPGIGTRQVRCCISAGTREASERSVREAGRIR